MSSNSKQPQDAGYIDFSAKAIVKELKRTGGVYDHEGSPTLNGTCGIEEYLRAKKGALQNMALEDLQAIYAAFEGRFPACIDFIKDDKKSLTEDEKKRISQEYKTKNDAMSFGMPIGDQLPGRLRSIGMFYNVLVQQIQILNCYTGNNNHFAWDRCDNESQFFDKGFLGVPVNPQSTEEPHKEQPKQSWLERLSCRGKAKSRQAEAYHNNHNNQPYFKFNLDIVKDAFI